ncbi:MAG: hypothetical protein IKD99_05080 [Erysipelotrichaceae bacterium]|nr:hypothetical protein [Erysipelotrichaceae bacterium]
MKGINIADLGVLIAVILLITICIKALISNKKSGKCSCGAASCSGCAGCKIAMQKR